LEVTLYPSTLGYWGCNSPTIPKNRLLILGTPDLIDMFPLASPGVDANPLYIEKTREELTQNPLYTVKTRGELIQTLFALRK